MTKEDLNKQLADYKRKLEAAKKHNLAAGITKAEKEIARIESELSKMSYDTEVLAFKKPTPKDLKKGLKVAYKDTDGEYTKTGTIDEIDAEGLYYVGGASYTADELRLLKSNEPKTKPRGLKEAIEQDMPDKHIEKMVGKKKLNLDKDGKQELDGGHLLLKKSDTTAVLEYSGDSKHVIAFSFEEGKWIIDCCETKHEKYPDFEKGELEDAVYYIIGELECKESKEKRKKQNEKRKRYAEREANKSDSEKVADKVEKVAEQVEKKVDNLKDEPVKTKDAESIKKDVLAIVKSVESNLQSKEESRRFVESLIEELKKLL
jgi:hypothetical protein